uniref:Uncharacterized protein n=1 Tax=Plectus sambesii TaxID=2011161 RepID=A0A914ULQ7_9BILA
MKPTDPCYYDELYSVEDVPKCLQHVKEKAADTQLFWFGDHWSQRCAETTAHDWIRCYNPDKLVRYTSVGSRLLRVPTFDLEYLRNLLIFPEVTFLSEPGAYTACDHRYETNVSRTTTVRPEMDPALPFDLRSAPTIGWPTLNDNDHFIVAIVDVGFGRLDYLAFDFPADTKVARDYRHSENFREQPNPHAVVVFRQSNGRLGSLRLTDAEDEDGLFDLQRFILDNNLQHDLIGLNWMSVSTDAYAIEKQRIKGLADNCHSLIHKKLLEHRELRFQFLPHFSLSELDAWLSVTYQCGSEEYSVCCSTYKTREEIAQLDPIGDKIFSPATLRSAPLIAATRLMPPEIYSYRRSGRDYVALIDGDRFTLLMVQLNPTDPKLGDELRPLLHWLVVDIPAAALGAGTLEGAVQLLPYIAPLPEETHPSRRFVFALFMQTDRQLISRRYDPQLFTTSNCPVEYAERCNFDVRQLMARYSLRLRAVNWLLTRYDPYVVYEMPLRSNTLELNYDTAASNGIKRQHRADDSAELWSRSRERVCTMIDLAGVTETLFTNDPTNRACYQAAADAYQAAERLFSTFDEESKPQWKKSAGQPNVWENTNASDGHLFCQTYQLAVAPEKLFDSPPTTVLLTTWLQVGWLSMQPASVQKSITSCSTYRPTM